MAASVSPYFILSPKGANKTKNEEETNDDKEKSSKNGKKEKGYKNKHVVLTRNELTRKRIKKNMTNNMFKLNFIPLSYSFFLCV
jgi:hypothetical protein